MADMFAPLVAQLKANPKTIVFTEGNDPRILEAASKLLAEGVLKVVMVGNEAECKAAAAAGNFDISAAEIIDPENYAGFDEMVNTITLGFHNTGSGCFHRQNRYQGRERPAGPDRCPDRRCIRHVLHLRGCHGCHLQCGPDQRSGQVHR